MTNAELNALEVRANEIIDEQSTWNAPSTVKCLIAELRREREKVKMLRDELKFYAQRVAGRTLEVAADDGLRARAALDKIREDG